MGPPTWDQGPPTKRLKKYLENLSQQPVNVAYCKLSDFQYFFIFRKSLYLTSLQIQILAAVYFEWQVPLSLLPIASTGASGAPIPSTVHALCIVISSLESLKLA